MKIVLIVANGNSNSKLFYQKLSKKVDFIIGVDGGAGKLIKCGIIPDLAVGDFDSIGCDELNLLKKKGVNILQFPEDKNYSDTELAINVALGKHFNTFILSGMLYGRIDHMLFNVSLLYPLLKKGKDTYILEEREEIYIVNGKKKIKTKKSSTVSLYPMTNIVQGVKTSGLKYQLNGKTLFKGKTLTLSNIAVSGEIQVEVKKGVLLVVIQKK
ncbi:MAG: thiamine diphosphokinase [Caldisericota bacterium]|nr:thiamine diphosphokinase [Caldisericota bacterium]